MPCVKPVQGCRRTEGCTTQPVQTPRQRRKDHPVLSASVGVADYVDLEHPAILTCKGRSLVQKQHKTMQHVLLNHGRDHQGPGLRNVHTKPTRALQPQQSAPGHDDPRHHRCGVHIACHRPWPHRQLKLVQAGDLQVPQLIHCLDVLGLQCLRTPDIDGGPVSRVYCLATVFARPGCWRYSRM